MTKQSELDFLDEDIAEYFHDIHPAQDGIPTENLVSARPTNANATGTMHKTNANSWSAQKS